KDRSRRCADHFRIKWTHRALAKYDACASKCFGRAQNRPDVPGILYTSQHDHWANLKPRDQIFNRIFLESHQRRHTLRSLAGYAYIKEPVRKQKRFNVRPNLRQKPLGEILRRLLKKHGAKTQSAADRLFDDADALNRAVAIFGTLGLRKCLSKLFC